MNVLYFFIFLNIAIGFASDEIQPLPEEILIYLEVNGHEDASNHWHEDPVKVKGCATGKEKRPVDICIEPQDTYQIRIKNPTDYPLLGRLFTGIELQNEFFTEAQQENIIATHGEKSKRLMAVDLIHQKKKKASQVMIQRW